MPAEPSKDASSSYPRNASQPARAAAVIAPSDTVDLPVYARAVAVGTAGSLKVIPINNADDAPVTFTVAAGAILPVQVRRVFASGTSAGSLVALYD